MKTQTATRIASGLLYAAIASVPLGLGVGTPAHAQTVSVAHTASQTPSSAKGKTPKWSKHEKKVMRQANKTCSAITDDVTWEFCVVGAFHLGDADDKTRRVLTVDDYKINNDGVIVLVQR